MLLQNSQVLFYINKSIFSITQRLRQSLFIAVQNSGVTVPPKNILFYMLTFGKQLRFTNQSVILVLFICEVKIYSYFCVNNIVRYIC